MIDPGTGLTILGSAGILTKLLGPTADYIGEGIAEFAEKRVENVKRIFAKAERKLGKQLDSPGTVPPRVLAGVLNEGSYFDDELSAEYFGGLLASSRTESGTDDRGTTLASLLGRLSTYQIHAHYVLYATARDLLLDLHQEVAMGTPEWRNRAIIYIPRTVLDEPVGLPPGPTDEEVLLHIAVGLYREDLIDDIWALGSPASHEHDFSWPPNIKELEPGLVYLPTLFGVELFSRAHGHSPLSWLDPDTTFSIDPPLELRLGALRLGV